MVICPHHPAIYTLPGKPCVTCKVETEAAKRQGHRKQDGNASDQKVKDVDAFINDGSKYRKKPGVKEGRRSFEVNPMRLNA